MNFYWLIFKFLDSILYHLNSVVNLIQYIFSFIYLPVFNFFFWFFVIVSISLPFHYGHVFLYFTDQNYSTCFKISCLLIPTSGTSQGLSLLIVFSPENCLHFSVSLCWIFWIVSWILQILSCEDFEFYCISPERVVVCLI